MSREWEISEVLKLMHPSTPANSALDLRECTAYKTRPFILAQGQNKGPPIVRASTGFCCLSISSVKSKNKNKQMPVGWWRARDFSDYPNILQRPILSHPGLPGWGIHIQTEKSPEKTHIQLKQPMNYIMLYHFTHHIPFLPVISGYVRPKISSKRT